MEEQMRNVMTFDGNMPPASAARRYGLALLVIVLIGILALNSIVSVATGHVGVVTLFGRVTGRTMGEGIHLMNPLAQVHQLSVKTQEVKERATVPSKEGLTMSLEASVLYHVQPDRAPDLFQRVGPSYPDVLLVPNFRSAMRSVTASNAASSL
jgi:prohibitin 1